MEQLCCPSHFRYFSYGDHLGDCAYADLCKLNHAIRCMQILRRCSKGKRSDGHHLEPLLGVEFKENPLPLFAEGDRQIPVREGDVFQFLDRILLRQLLVYFNPI